MNSNRIYKCILIYLLLINEYIHTNYNIVYSQVVRDTPTPPTTDLACSLNICSELGEPCSRNSQFSGFQCYVEDRCNNGTCVKSLGQGEECQDSRDCNLGFSCVTPLSSLSFTSPNKTKTCESAFFAEYGEDCKRATDCLHSLDCINGICQTPRYGCLSDFHCKKNSICDDVGVCQEVELAENECFVFHSFPCRNVNQPCALKSLNISSIGICKDKIEEGAPCLTTKFTCDWSSNQFCDPIEKGSTLGTCKTSPKNSLSTCISQKDCGIHEFCKCDSHSGVGYCIARGTFVGRYCKEAANIFLDCYRKTNCSQPFSLNPTSCIFRYCREEAQCLGTFCTEPMLPVEVCVNRKCNLSIFNSTGIKTLSNQSKLSPFTKLIFLNIIITTIIINKIIK